MEVIFEKRPNIVCVQMTLDLIFCCTQQLTGCLSVTFLTLHLCDEGDSSYSLHWHATRLRDVSVFELFKSFTLLICLNTDSIRKKKDCFIESITQPICMNSDTFINKTSLLYVAHWSILLIKFLYTEQFFNPTPSHF